MKSQEAAFRQARKPAKKVKETVEVKAATPAGIRKNKSRNERRKAARRTASLMKAGKLGKESEASNNEAKEDEGESVSDNA
jgi:uncharacterized protein YciW